MSDEYRDSLDNNGDWKKEVIEDKESFLEAKKHTIAQAQEELQMHIEKWNDNCYPSFVNNLDIHEEWDEFIDMMEHNFMSALADTLASSKNWKIMMNMYMWDQYTKNVLFRYIKQLENEN